MVTLRFYTSINLRPLVGFTRSSSVVCLRESVPSVIRTAVDLPLVLRLLIAVFSTFIRSGAVVPSSEYAMVLSS